LRILKAQLEHSTHLQSLPGTSSIPLLIDCGASACMSPSESDFKPDTIRKLPSPDTMRGIGGDVQIRQAVIIRYTTLDDGGGNPAILRAPGFLVPELAQRLISPQIFFQTGGKGGEFTVLADRSLLKLGTGQTITVPLDPSSRLLYTHAFEDVQVQANNLASSLHITSEANANLTRAQKDLLRRCTMRLYTVDFLKLCMLQSLDG
jgi:hypothetical protein